MIDETVENEEQETSPEEQGGDEREGKQEKTSGAEVAISRRSKPDRKDSGLWLVTFTDIMALMLTFFVMLYSMSVPEVEKWEEMTTGLSRGLSKFKSAAFNRGEQQEISINKLDFSRALDLDYLQNIVESILADNENLQEVVVVPQDGRLLLSIPFDLLFDVGQADIGVEGKKALFSIGGALSRIRNRVEVIGHADPRPIDGGAQGYSSNWSLSLARAVSVATVLENVGYSRSVIVRGLSSARYGELPSAMEEEKRLDLSRRVDIVIMKDDGSSTLFMPVEE